MWVCLQFCNERRYAERCDAWFAPKSLWSRLWSRKCWEPGVWSWNDSDLGWPWRLAIYFWLFLTCSDGLFEHDLCRPRNMLPLFAFSACSCCNFDESHCRVDRFWMILNHLWAWKWISPVILPVLCRSESLWCRQSPILATAELPRTSAPRISKSTLVITCLDCYFQLSELSIERPPTPAGEPKPRQLQVMEALGTLFKPEMEFFREHHCITESSWSSDVLSQLVLGSCLLQSGLQ